MGGPSMAFSRVRDAEAHDSTQTLKSFHPQNEQKKERIMLNAAVAPESQARKLPDGGERRERTIGPALPIDELSGDRFTPVALKLFLADPTDGTPVPLAVMSSPPD